jgi:DNA-binding HxlR family transcriptional regulator
MRAGATILLMAANPIHRGILRKVLERPLELAPGEIYRVSGGGREMLYAAFVVEQWLQSAPHGPLVFDSKEAESAVTALAEGWSASIVHMLAREPLTFAELEAAVGKVAIEEIGREELERLVAAMHASRQLEALPGAGDEPIYVLTDWLRAGIAPLIASARLERSNPMEGMSPIDELDVEAGFRMALALVELPNQLSGSCRLGFNLDDSESKAMTGVTAEIDQGKAVACRPELDIEADAWAAASAADWLDTVIEPDTDKVRTGGDAWLTKALVEAFHRTLFGIPLQVPEE